MCNAQCPKCLTRCWALLPTLNPPLVNTPCSLVYYISLLALLCLSAHTFGYNYQPIIDVYKYSFLPRTVPEWNRLDDEIIETDYVEEFKQKLAPFMYMVK